MAIKPNFAPSHIGSFIKRSVLPDDMTVTEAADLLGVTRPTLSLLLNERASLSSEMALRIEKVFGVKMDTLLRMQTRHTIWHARQEFDKVKVKTYHARPEPA